MKKFFQEFKDFALKGNVMDLAVAVIIGAAFQAIINSVVKDLITPLLGLIIGGLDFSNLYIPLTSSSTPIASGSDITVADATLEQLEAAGIGVFKYGNFITAVINFIIMALIIFLMVKGINRLSHLRRKEEEAPEPTTKECPFCKTEIAVGAVRCPNCTSVLDEEAPDEE